MMVVMSPAESPTTIHTDLRLVLRRELGGNSAAQADADRDDQGPGALAQVVVAAAETKGMPIDPNLPYDDANIGFRNAAFNYEVLPNANLQPETSDGIEGGLRARFPGVHIHHGPAQDAGLIHDQDARRIAAALATLEPRHAAAIRACYFDGVTYDELAAREQVPVGTLKSWVRRGLIRLRDLLEGSQA